MPQQTLQQIQNEIFVPFVTAYEDSSISANITSNTGVATQMYINCYPKKVTDNEYYLSKRPGMQSTESNASSRLKTVLTGEAGTPACNICLAHMKTSTDYYVALMAYMNPSTGAVSAQKALVFYDPIADASEAKLFTPLAGATSLGDFYFLNEFQSYTSDATYPYNTNPVITVTVTNAARSSSDAWTSTYSGGSPVWGTPAVISDAYFPTNASASSPGYGLTADKVIIGNFAFLNGTAYIMTTDGIIFNSNKGDVTSWTPATGLAPGWVRAQTSPDNGCGVINYKHHIVAFGQSSIEFWSDIGDPSGSPLQRQDQATIGFGISSPKHILNLNDNLYFFPRKREGNVGLYKLDGYTPVVITPPGFAKYVSEYRSFADTDFLDILTFDGETFVTFNSASPANYTTGFGTKDEFYNNLYNLANGGYRYNTITGAEEAVTADGVYDDIKAIAQPQGILCVDINTGFYWIFSKAQKAAGSATLAYRSSLGINSNFNYYIQANVSSAGGWEANLHNFPIVESATAYSDHDTGSNYYYYPVAVKTNQLHFGNLNRKTLAKLTINEIFPEDIQMEDWDSNAVYGSVLAWSDMYDRRIGSLYSSAAENDWWHYSQTDGAGRDSQATFRYKLFTGPQTQNSFERLGMFRTRSFYYSVYSPSKWIGRGFNLRIALGAS